MSTTNELDRENAKFWSFLCGSALAQAHGITEFNKTGLEKYDAAYFGYYPYLVPFIDPQNLKSKKILEIGLGLGSVGRSLASNGADVTGLDISPPVAEFYVESAKIFGVKTNLSVGSAAKIPFANNSFDCVVSIGCLHHTGSVANCLNEVSRVLKPGGQIVGMIYNRYSLRQWMNWPRQTFMFWLREYWGSSPKDGSNAQQDQIHSYDYDTAGASAPFTEFYSRKMLRSTLRASGFEKMEFSLKNFDDYTNQFGQWATRERFLGTLDKFLGLDIYFKASKKS